MIGLVNGIFAAVLVSYGRPARLLGGVMDWLANADAGLVGTVFAVLVPVVLVASLLYFDLFHSFEIPLTPS